MKRIMAEVARTIHHLIMSKGIVFLPRSKSFCNPCSRTLIKNLTTSAPVKTKSYQVVVVGGGAGGCGIAAKFARKLGPQKVAIIEPADTHYFQPMWTLVGGGVKVFSQSGKPMVDVLPKQCVWHKDSAVSFDPDNNELETKKGEKIRYDYLVVATGLQLDYHLIKGLPEAFKTPGVCSNFSKDYVQLTYPSIQNFKQGNAIFTLPNSLVKCAGAPQKIMYLTEDYFRKNNKRDKANIIFNSSQAAIFGVKKYATALNEIIAARGIQVNYRLNLIEVLPEKKEAIFENLDKPEEHRTFKYEMLHITPPMSAQDVLKKSLLVDVNGWVDVNKITLQHVKYPNVFGIGDCTNVPTSKTAAAVAAQIGVLFRNLSKAIEGKKLEAQYDGYTSCPLITGYGRCILAEFDFNGEPLETLPINQAKERWISYVMKKDMMPELYWKLFLRGYWEGPQTVRKILHLGMSK